MHQSTPSDEDGDFENLKNTHTNTSTSPTVNIILNDVAIEFTVDSDTFVAIRTPKLNLTKTKIFGYGASTTLVLPEKCVKNLIPKQSNKAFR